MSNPDHLHDQVMNQAAHLLLHPPSERLERSEWERELSEVVQHLGRCQRCLMELDVTIRLLSRGTDSLLPQCAECSELLPEYSRLEESAAQEQFPLVWLHVQTCDACRSRVINIQRMIAKERAGVYGVIPRGSVWEATLASAATLVWQLEGGIQKFLAHVAVVKQEAEVRFQVIVQDRLIQPQDFSPSLRLQFAAVPIRDGVAEPQILWTLTLPPVDGFKILLTCYAVDETHLDLRVELRAMESDEPISGAGVTLTDPQNISLPPVETDDKGIALLENIQPKPYNLAITHAERAWWVPLDLLSR